MEDGEVTVGMRSIAVPVLDHNGHPVAGLAVTYPGDAAPEPDPAVVSHFARLLSQRLGARLHPSR
jgi:DNA-binding IclR family transcriptional regulator